MDTQHPASPPGPTYISQFPERWDLLCSQNAMAAVDSPVAYLQALYRFALELESTGEGQEKITLDKRRPELKTLVIDEPGLTTLIPQLSVVNETLSHHLDTYLQHTLGENRGRTRDAVLSRQRYPFVLPFDLVHQQCWLSLNAGKPLLGEISYRISLTLPLSQRGQNTYGVVSQEAYEAQRLLTGLSPAQQTILTEHFSEKPGPKETNDFFIQHYGATEDALKVLPHWSHHTELSADQTQALLACGKYRPVLSANVSSTALAPAPLPFHPGAAFVNGPLTDKPRLTLEPDEHGVMQLKNTSWSRYQRLHRMIRLQRWLQLPFDQLDTLLLSVMRCEQECDPQFQVNDNILRALGVYRYLNRRHRLQPPELAALLNELPIRAPATQASLFDQVFNQATFAGHTLRVDELNVSLEAELPDTLRHQLCAALGLRDTPDSLKWLIEQARLHLPTPCPTLTFYCALYRQARIARLLGVTVTDSYHLAELLGGSSYTAQLVKPYLRRSGSNAPADLLDVLMQMDWLVGWLKDSHQSTAALRRQLVLDTEVQTPQVRMYLEQFNELVNLTRHGLLLQSDLDDLTLPQPAKAPVNWHAIIVQGLLRSHPLRKLSPPKELPKGLVQLIEDQTLSQDHEENQALHNDAKQAVSKKLGEFYQQLQPLRDRIDALFESASHPSYDPALSLQSRKHTARQLVRAATAASTTEVLKHLLLALPDAQVFLGLPVRREALHAFLLNPEWLSKDQAPGSILKLTLNTVYLLQRFEHCLSANGVTEQTLLAYLQQANTPSTSGDPSLSRTLAALLKWTRDEVELLSQRLPTKQVTTMADLDWVLRCHEVARLTGLSANALLKAADLPATFINDDWKHVGSALIATAQ